MSVLEISVSCQSEGWEQDPCLWLVLPKVGGGGSSVAWALGGMAINRALSRWTRTAAGGARPGTANAGEVKGAWGMHPAEMHGLSEVCTRRKLDPASGANS